MNRLYHATLWCLGAGNASQTQLNVTFALSRLVHPHSDACVQTVLPRSCIYLSPSLLGGRTGCTMRCFRAWELAMHHAQRSSSTSLNSGLMHPKTMPVCKAYVHTSEGGTEKLLAMTVPVQWQRASIGSRKPTGPDRGMVARTIAPVISQCRWEKS